MTCLEPLTLLIFNLVGGWLALAMVLVLFISHVVRMDATDIDIVKISCSTDSLP